MFASNFDKRYRHLGIELGGWYRDIGSDRLFSEAGFHFRNRNIALPYLNDPIPDLLFRDNRTVGCQVTPITALGP